MAGEIRADNDAPATETTGTAASSTPLYIGEGAETIFGVLHEPPADSSPAAAVLLCPPFGWEEFCSYRSRRTWAARLAAAGHPTLRLDLPGTGDSAGSPYDPDRLGAWTGAVSTASTWLSERAGGARLAAIGIGLGGLITVRAAQLGAPIDDLVLWAVPARGRKLVRELQTFARLNAVDVDPSTPADDDAEPEVDQPREDGSLEVGGFALSADTLAALESLDLLAAGLPERPGRRALMLERAKIGVDKRLREYLAAGGLEPMVAPGPGYVGMMAHPQETVLPEREIETVAAWLAEAPHDPAEPRPGPSVPEPTGSAEIPTPGGPVRERPLAVAQPFGLLSGVLSEAPGDPAPGLCAVMLNAGALRRIGPGRLWVDIARRWALAGVPTLRIDLEAIGDSDGSGDPYETAELYTPGFVDQVVAVLDELERQGIGSRFVLTGLCSGAYWAFQTALEDRRVTAGFMLNPRILVWDPKLEDARSARLVGRSLRESSWRRIVRGEFPLRRAMPIARSALRSFAHRRAASRAEAAQQRGVEVGLDRMAAAGQRAVFVFGGREPLFEEFEAGGLVPRLQRRENVVLERLPGRDHTLRPVAAQQRAAELLDRELAVEVDRAANGG